MDKKSITEFWNDTLIRFNMKSLSDYSLSKETQDFLCSIGLPIKCEFLKDLCLSFYDDFEQININDSEYIVIGDDYGTKLCIVGKTGEVVSVDIEGNMNIRFINSNIECFLFFLQIFLTKKPELAGVDDEEAAEIVKAIKNSFNKFDLAALSDDDNWWAVILEQVEQGIL